jgi:hypothetical protein
MYKNIDEWLDETEGFGIRRERIPEDALPWLQTAWELATKAERDRCAKLARAQKSKLTNADYYWNCAIDHVVKIIRAK